MKNEVRVKMDDEGLKVMQTEIEIETEGVEEGGGDERGGGEEEKGERRSEIGKGLKRVETRIQG